MEQSLSALTDAALYSLAAESNEAAEGSGYELISRLNGIITQGNRTKEDEFEFNKDAGMYRYKIKAKNSELKHRHGYDTASSSGLINMEMQGAMAIFAVNLKRIIKLMNVK